MKEAIEHIDNMIRTITGDRGSTVAKLLELREMLGGEKAPKAPPRNRKMKPSAATPVSPIPEAVEKEEAKEEVAPDVS